jgi:hypothetical protein
MALMRMKDGIIDAPIPGQGLTNPPGSFPWERPPQIVDPEEAADFIWKKLRQTDNLQQALTIMDAGMPITMLVTRTLMTGVFQGLWTLDMVPVLYQAVTSMYEGLAATAGIKYQLKPDQPSPADMAMAQIAQAALREPSVQQEADEVNKRTEGLLKLKTDPNSIVTKNPEADMGSDDKGMK